MTSEVLRRRAAVRYVSMLRPILGAAVAALVLAGCGSVDTRTGGAPTPSSQMLHFDVAVSERNNAATMHVGQKLEVVLHSYDRTPKTDPRSVRVPRF